MSAAASLTATATATLSTLSERISSGEAIALSILSILPKLPLQAASESFYGALSELHGPAAALGLRG